jgi:hypothetical protein
VAVDLRHRGASPPQRVQAQQPLHQRLAGEERRQHHRAHRHQRDHVEDALPDLAQDQPLQRHDHRELARLREQQPALDRRAGEEAGALGDQRHQRWGGQQDDQRQDGRLQQLLTGRQRQHAAEREEEDGGEEVAQRAELGAGDAARREGGERDPGEEGAGRERQVEQVGERDEEEEDRDHREEEHLLLVLQPRELRRDPAQDGEGEGDEGQGLEHAAGHRPDAEGRLHHQRDQQDHQEVLQQEDPDDQAAEGLEELPPALQEPPITSVELARGQPEVHRGQRVEPEGEGARVPSAPSVRNCRTPTCSAARRCAPTRPGSARSRWRRAGRSAPAPGCWSRMSGRTPSGESRAPPAGGRGSRGGSASGPGRARRPRPIRRMPIPIIRSPHRPLEHPGHLPGAALLEMIRWLAPTSAARPPRLVEGVDAGGHPGLRAR